MKKLFKYLKYRKQIMALIRYSFEEVKEYKYLTKKEKEIIKTNKEFIDIKSL